MPKPSYADVHLDIDPAQPQKEPVHSRPDRDTPFRMLVLGDFSGRASRGIVTKGSRKPILVDRDNFEDVLESLDVTLRLPLDGAGSLDIVFRELDDFHPDRLYMKLPVFKKIRALRDQLDDPSTFKSAANELGFATAPPPRAPSAADAMESALGGSLLEASMEATAARVEGRPAPRAADPMSNYLRALVAPHLTPKPDPKRAEVAKQLDEATSAALRGLLHHPLYQELEAAWRGLYFLIKELETGPQLKVYIVDISKSELEADLAAADDLKTTAVYKLIVDQTVRTPGADPWAVVIGNYSFSPEMRDLNLLGRMGMLARQAGAPLLASASPRLLGAESIAATPYPEDWKAGAEQEGWSLIRSLPEARYIGLVLPRFLLRMPYGKTTDACEQLAFEEMPDLPNHEDYLWGNSAFVCGYLLGQMFTEHGWGMEGSEILDLHRLPMHVYKQDGESKIRPCAETFLTQTAMEKIHDHGLMALMSFANSDRVRLAGFRSAAAPPAGLSGRWG